MKIRYNIYAHCKLFIGMIRGYTEPCLTPVGPEEGFETEADALEWFKINCKRTAFKSCVILKNYVYE